MLLRQVKVLPILLILLLFFLQYRLWFDTGGIIDMFHFKKKLATQMEKNTELKKRNEELARQIELLQANENAIESRARHDLGMIKQGETFYQVVDEG
jgi:cell division protein FtsB